MKLTHWRDQRLTPLIRNTALSLVLLGFVAAMWERSHQVADVLRVVTPSASLNGLASYRGQLMLMLTSVPVCGDEASTMQLQHVSPRRFSFTNRGYNHASSWQVELAGFGMARGGPRAFGFPECSFLVMRLPYWFLMALPGTLLLLTVVRAMVVTWPSADGAEMAPATPVVQNT